MKEFITVGNILGLFSAIATLIGAYWGAKIAGNKTLESVKEQILYDRAKETENKKERFEKMIPIINRHNKNLMGLISHLEFLVEERKRGQTVNQEIYFKDNLNSIMIDIILVKENLDKIQIDLMTIEVNEKIQEVIGNIAELKIYIDIFNNTIGDNDFQTGNIANVISKVNYACTDIMNLLKQ